MSSAAADFFASPVFLGMVVLFACTVAGTSLLYFCRPQRGPGYWCACCWLLLGAYVLFAINRWWLPLPWAWLSHGVMVGAQGVLMLGILCFLGQKLPLWIVPVSVGVQLGCDLWAQHMAWTLPMRDAAYCMIVAGMPLLIIQRMRQDMNKGQVRAVLIYIRVALGAFVLVHLVRLLVGVQQSLSGAEFAGDSIPFLSLYTGLPFLVIALVALTAMSLHGALSKSLALEQEARASLTRFEQLMRISSAAMLMLRRGHIQESNGKLGEMFGAERETLQGLDFEQLFYPDDEVPGGLGALQGQVFHRVAKRADLSHFHAEVTLLPLGHDQCLAEIRDVTQQKTMEASLTLLASVDPLTGALNRRAFFEQYTRTRQGEQPWCLAMLDLDHFKHINDRHGHAVGDEVLAGFARLCLTRTRRNDLFARFGGEEFVLLLVDCDGSDAQDFLARLRAELAAAGLGGEALALQVTFSAGLVCYPAGAALGEVLAQADKALYQAKSDGRDRVETVVMASVG